MKKEKWWINDKRKIRDVLKKLDESSYDRYDRTSNRRIEEFDPKIAENYQNARTRSFDWIGLNKSLLDFEEGGKAVRLIMKILGKQPDVVNKFIPYRSAVWGVNIEDGIEVSNALVGAGIKEFRITPAGWLTIRLKPEIFVSSFYTSEDPEVWKQRNAKRLKAGWKKDLELTQERKR